MSKLYHFNKSAVFSKTYIVSSYEDYIRFLIQESDFDSSNVAFYPEKIDDEVLSYDLIVLHPYQEEQKQILSNMFREKYLQFHDSDLLDYLDIDMSVSEIIELAKTNMSYRVLHVFMSLWADQQWNPAWIKNYLFSDKPWFLLSFVDGKKLASDYESVKKFYAYSSTLHPLTLVQLLYTELSGEKTVEYDFFMNAIFSNSSRIQENELEGFDVNTLLEAGVLYSPEKEVYALVVE